MILTHKQSAHVAILVLVGLSGVFPIHVRANDVSSHLDLIGNPAMTSYPGAGDAYARNAWDMAAFGVRLYIGSGNSSNEGPRQNAGIVKLWVYDPTTRTFTSPYTVYEEQIDRFRLIGDRLYIPGHDPRDDWTLGNLYWTTNGTAFTKVRTITEGVHMYDLYQYGDKLFAALGTGGLSPNTGYSVNQGTSWTLVPVPGTPPSGYMLGRAHSFFEMAGSLYICSDPFMDISNPSIYASSNTVYRWTGSSFETAAQQFFPGHTSRPVWEKTIRRTANLNGGLAYIAAKCWNDHQSIPWGLFRADAAGQIAQVSLPANVLPYDLITENGVMLVLLNEKHAATDYTVSVLQTTDLNEWSEVLTFSSRTLARSFALLDGDLYFGMGTEADNPSSSGPYVYSGDPAFAGNIYRVDSQYFTLASESEPEPPTSGYFNDNFDGPSCGWEVVAPTNTAVKVINDPTGGEHGRVIEFDDDNNTDYPQLYVKMDIQRNHTLSWSFDIYLASDCGDMLGLVVQGSNGTQMIRQRWLTDVGAVYNQVESSSTQLGTQPFTRNAWYHVVVTVYPLAHSTSEYAKYDVLMIRETDGAIILNEKNVSGQYQVGIKEDYLKFGFLPSSVDSNPHFYVDNVEIASPH